MARDRENKQQEETDDLFASYRKTLDAHGYGFQYAVLRRADELCKKRESQWYFEVAEFPVIVRGHDTRIDFILRWAGSNLYLLAECKRANPALSNWCFAEAPYVRRNRQSQIILQRLKGAPDGEPRATIIKENPPGERTIYHVGMEVRTGQKGDPCGSGRGAIEAACTQVCRGLNGMMGFSAEYRNIGNPVFFPAIFTTARLWTSKMNLAGADLETGRLDASSPGMESVPWLLYQYHQSPGIRHALLDLDAMPDLGDYLWHESARTIAIISPSGIEHFLKMNWAGILL